MERYSGTVTTTGNSGAIRLEKSLFRAHPEFAQGQAVTAAVIAPGQILLSVNAAQQPETEVEADPVLGAFLAFIAKDIHEHPDRLAPVSSGAVARLENLTAGVSVDDGEVFPPDVSS